MSQGRPGGRRRRAGAERVRPVTSGVRLSLTGMAFRRLLAQAAVTDLEVAERWYATLFDAPPHTRPMDGLLEWHLGASFGVQVFLDPVRAGRSTLVLDESDLDVLASRLSAAGLGHAGPQPVTASRVLRLSDPDGNQVVVTGA